jgi:MFS family permease
MILSALALAIAPVFTDCESTGKMLTTADGRSVSMKCHWTGVAEIAAAVPLALAGIFALFGRRKETLRFAGIVGAASGLMAILLPTVLIGTCMNAAMTCNVLMRPILLASGILAIAASVALFFVAREPELPAAQAAT